MSRIFIWLESSTTLNFVSERDPDEIVQTHVLSWAFADHVCHKYQHWVFTSLYEAPRKSISCSGPSCVQEKSTRIEW